MLGGDRIKRRRFESGREYLLFAFLGVLFVQVGGVVKGEEVKGCWARATMELKCTQGKD